MAKWKIHKKICGKDLDKRRELIVEALLKKRGLKTKPEVESFFRPAKPSELTLRQVGISKREVNKAIKRIKKAIKAGEKIIVYGDYDADGICATAILWETLNRLGVKTMPFIPHRQKHGYGISRKGVDEIMSNEENNAPLIITVDNGVVAHRAIEYAKKRGIDVIVSDHHVAGNKLPKAKAVVHTTSLAGAGVAWILAREVAKAYKKGQADNLELAAIGSVADMVPLKEANRSMVKHGLKKLNRTKRIGLIELLKESGRNERQLGTYDINFVVAPRLNAMGRLGHALDSLRLICTKSKQRARDLASMVGSTNRDRQELTENQLLHAKDLAEAQVKSEKIILVGDEEYHEGVIGLIAGKLVESYWRPAIVLSHGRKRSKASARSIPGFNIIEALREVGELLVDVGGHPMAAGFTVENEKIEALTERLQQIARKRIEEEHLKKTLEIDCEISLADISWKLYRSLEKFEPFGMANPRPVLACKNVEVTEAKAVGREGKHLKLRVKDGEEDIGGIGFGLGVKAARLNSGDKINLAYNIDENEWNGKKELQLLVKGISF